MRHPKNPGFDGSSEFSTSMKLCGCPGIFVKCLFGICGIMWAMCRLPDGHAPRPCHKSSWMARSFQAVLGGSGGQSSAEAAARLGHFHVDLQSGNACRCAFPVFKGGWRLSANLKKKSQRSPLHSANCLVERLQSLGIISRRGVE